MLLVCDELLFQITYNNKILRLRPKEYDLLKILIENSHRILSKSQLIDIVWPHLPKNSRVVDTNVSRLRTKLKILGHPGIYVSSKRGYRLITEKPE